MGNNINIQFSTLRLDVGPWHLKLADVRPPSTLAAIVQDTLTEKVTKALPPPWQGEFNTARAENWIAERDAEGVTLLALEKQSSTPVGLIVLFVESTREWRLGYMLCESAWGQGYASELITGLMDWCTANGVHRVTGGVAPGNIASVRVLEKAHFKQVQRQGASDELFFEWRLADSGA